MTDYTLFFIDFGFALITALAASFHCAGMCGGFVIGACGGQRLLPSQALYHLGKTMVYIGLGAIVGLAGINLARAGTSWDAFTWLALVAGVLMIGMGVKTLGFFSTRIRLKKLDLNEKLAPVTSIAGCATAYRGPFRALVLGTLSGLLPCPLVYAFVAKAAATGSIAMAMSTMAALGLGTVPVLFGVAASGKIFSPVLRQHMVKASGVFMVLLGFYTCWRGFSTPPCCH